MTISVIIPSYNSEQVLPAALNALREQVTTQLVEVIVVDCSGGNGVKKLCAEFDFVKFHHQTERFNPGIGRNIGAKLAQGELLVFIDADVVLSPSSIDAAWKFRELGNAVFGGALQLNEDTAVGLTAYFEHDFFNHESHKLRTSEPRSNLSSALLAIDCVAFRESGGFRDIPRMQDTEFTERLARGGVQLMFCPQMHGYQSQTSTLSKVLRKIYINGKNLYYIRYADKRLFFKFLLFLLLPIITLAKVGRIFSRHMRYHDYRRKIITVLVTPLLLIGGVVWAVGLYTSMLWGGGIGELRE